MAILAQHPSLRREIFFFDARLSDLLTLTSSLLADAEIHLIDPTLDGLEQIALTLEGSSGIDAIHLFSHGSAGSLQLGSTTLSRSTITGYAATLSQIGASLSSTGDILLYGCNVGAGAEGQPFVESIARLTMADVAASDDLTGSTTFGGDWVLEVQSGVVESVVKPLAGFDGVLGNTAPTFMVGDGKVTTAIGIGVDSGRSVVVQSDGKILVAGYSYNDNNYDVALVRYNSNGTLDTTFSGDGRLTTSISTGNDYGYSMALQSDGKIVVAGTSNGDFAIVRYNSNGTLDTTFDVDGKVTTSFDSGDDNAQSIAVQSDGKIVVAGYSYNSTTGTNNFGVARYNSDGSLDTTFDTDGKLTTAIGTANDNAQSIVVQSDGKIVVAGYSYYSSSYGYNFALVRYNSNGSLDTTFDTDGKVTTDLGSYYADDYGYSIAVQSDGKIVIAGTGNNGDFALVRYNSNGSLDTTFDTDSKVTTAIGTGYDYAQSVAVQSDGKILVAGRSYNGVISGYDIALARYNSNGSLDTTFDDDGKVTTAIGNYDDYGWSVTVQSDGKILVTGESNSDVVLVRYNRDGSLDTRFDSTMQNTLNGSPVYTEGSAAVALDSDVQIFDAELAALGNYSGATLALARHGGSSTDDHFSGAGIVAGQATGTVTAASIGIGSYTWTSGSLQVTFNELATQRLVNQAMQSLAYQNSSDSLSSSLIQIDWTFNDGNSGSQGIGDTLSATGSTTVHIPDNTAPTFMIGDGKVTKAIGIGVDSGRSVVVQSDGKILVAGFSSNDNNYDVALIRYNSNGTLDTTFSGDGKVTTAIGIGDDYGWSVAVQSDGKIVVAGTTDGDFAIVRYNSNGTLDTTFDADGKVITSFDSGDDSAQSIAVQSDGKIVVAGYSYNSTTGTNNFGVARYNSDGSLDTTFDTDGKLTTALGIGNDYGYSLALQSDGKIVVAGYSYYSSSYGYNFALVRYNSNGSLDTTFDTDGKVTTDLGSYYADDYGYSIAVQSDGKIVVAGTGYNGDFALVRYNSNGSLDTTFDTDSKVTTSIGIGYDYAQSIAMQSDGKILVAGQSYNSAILGYDIALVRYNSNGSLDTTFDSDGKVTTAIGNYDDYGWSVAVQSDGKILVTGESNGDVVLVRYNHDGSLDARFDSTMQNTLNGSPVYTEGSAAVALDSDVQIFDAELAALGSYSGATLALTRHGGSYTDDRFSGAGIVAGQASGTVTAASIDIGSYTWTNGSLLVTFNELATQRLVNQAMQSLAYQNANDTLSSSSIQIDWTFNDGNSGSQGIGDTLSTTGNTTVHIPDNTAPTFMVGDGKVTTAIGTGVDSGRSVVVQSDGKILVAGYSYNDNNYDVTLARYNSDGTLDTTFSGDGRLITSISTGNDYGYSVALQSDGKIVVAGTSNGDFAIVRYNSNGSLDTTFDADGKIITSFDSGDDSAQSIAVQSDGKIVVAGYSNDSTTGTNNFGVARYNSDGSLDTTFDTDGKLTTALGTGNDYGYSLALQSDGKIVVAGYSYYSSSYGYNFALVRYNSNGSLDTTFNTDGKVTTDLGSYYADDYGYSIAVQSDGKIVVAGTGYNGDFALVRYNSNGSLDTTFDTDSKVTTPIGTGYDYAQSVAVQSDGKILVAGRSYNGVISGFDIALVRYNSNGSLDTTFDADGKVTTSIGNYDDYGWSVTVQSDGKILVTGESNSDVVLVRYNRDGSLDTRFDSTMQNTLNGSPVYTEGSAAVALDSDVQIFDAELAALGNYSGATLALARHGGSSDDDHFSGAGIVAGQATGTVTAASVGIGSYTWINGSLLVTFNEFATQRLVNQAMQSLAYQNANNTLSSSSIQIDWTFNDGNSGSQGIGDTLSTTGSTTVSITALNNIPEFTAFAVPVESTKEYLQTEISFADLAAAGNETDSDGTITAFVVASLSSGRLKIGTNSATATFWNPTSNNTIDTTHHAYWLPETNALGTVNAFTAVAQDSSGGHSATPVQATVTVQPVNDAPVMLWHQTSVFAAKTNFGTGIQPIAITNGDFNGDGKPDLATANQVNQSSSSTVSVLLNNGNGTFANKIESATSAPTSLTSADFNGDGHADLAVASPSGNIVSVLSGGIAAKVDYQTGAGSGPCAVTSADFNNDGYADLATANKTNQTASVLLNNGNGTFAAKTDYTVGLWACALAAADFNSDGKADLAVANRDSDSISILLNNGNGTFAAKKDYSTGDAPTSVTAADFNGDGYTDLAIANSASDTVTLLHNLGNGNFVLANVYSVGDAPSAVTSADVNGDGYTDLVVANSLSDNVTMLLNNGDGTFTTISNDAAGDAPSAITSADFNGDGKIDLAVAIFGEKNISLLMNKLQPPALSAVARQTAVPIAGNIVITDPDGNESWNGGSLRVEITAHAETTDTLALPTTNPGNNGIWLDSPNGNSIMAGAVAIGTADAASVADATAWTLSFNSNATNELVQNVARALTFTSSSTVTTAAERDITLTASDNGGNSSYAILHYTSNADTPTEFGTNPTDITAPTLSSFLQSEAVTGVATTSNLTFIFSETIRSGSGVIELHNHSENGTVVEHYNVATSSNLTIAGDTLTINPSADLQNGTHYFVTFEAGAIKDRAGNSYAGTDVCHVKTEGISPEYHNLTGDITFWKNGHAVDSVTTTLTSQPATQLVELRNMQLAADGSRTVEIWTTATTVNSLQLEFVLPTGSKASWQSDTGLPQEWTLLANSELDGQFILGGMSTTALASGAVKLGTLALTATTTPQHAELLLSKGFVGHNTIPAFGVAIESITSGNSANYQHPDVLQGNYTLAGTKAGGTAEHNAVDANDALAALKIAVALNPNDDGSAVSPYQFLAADINHDGIIRSTDALNILKMAVKLPGAPASEWIFTTENAAESATMDRSNVDWSHVIPTVTLDHDIVLDLIGIVKGDVDGSWAAAG